MSESKERRVKHSKRDFSMIDTDGRSLQVNGSLESVHFSSGNTLHVFAEVSSMLAIVKIIKGTIRRHDKLHGIERKKKPNAGKRGDEALALLNERFFLDDGELCDCRIERYEAWADRLENLLKGQTPERVTTPTAHDKVAAELAETIVTLEASEEVVSKQAVEIADLKETVMDTEVMRDNAITHTKDIRRERNGRVAELTKSRDEFKTERDELKTRLVRIGAAHIENSLESHSKAIVERDELLGLIRERYSTSDGKLCGNLSLNKRTENGWHGRMSDVLKRHESKEPTVTKRTNDPRWTAISRTISDLRGDLKAMTVERDVAITAAASFQAELDAMTELLGKWRTACQWVVSEVCGNFPSDTCGDCPLHHSDGNICGTNTRSAYSMSNHEIPLPKISESAIQDPTDTNGGEGDK